MQSNTWVWADQCVAFDTWSLNHSSWCQQEIVFKIQVTSSRQKMSKQYDGLWYMTYVVTQENVYIFFTYTHMFFANPHFCFKELHSKLDDRPSKCFNKVGLLFPVWQHGFGPQRRKTWFSMEFSLLSQIRTECIGKVYEVGTMKCIITFPTVYLYKNYKILIHVHLIQEKSGHSCIQ